VSKETYYKLPVVAALCSHTHIFIQTHKHTHTHTHTSESGMLNVIEGKKKKTSESGMQNVWHKLIRQKTKPFEID
jgi:hypothetical protein